MLYPFNAEDMDCIHYYFLSSLEEYNIPCNGSLLALRNNQIRAIEMHLVKTPLTKFATPENDTSIFVCICVWRRLGH